MSNQNEVMEQYKKLLIQYEMEIRHMKEVAETLESNEKTEYIDLISKTERKLKNLKEKRELLKPSVTSHAYMERKEEFKKALSLFLQRIIIGILSFLLVYSLPGIIKVIYPYL